MTVITDRIMTDDQAYGSGTVFGIRFSPALENLVAGLAYVRNGLTGDADREDTLLHDTYCEIESNGIVISEKKNADAGSDYLNIFHAMNNIYEDLVYNQKELDPEALAILNENIEDLYL